MTHALALRQARWRHPEGGAAAVAAGAWALALAPVVAGGPLAAAHAAFHRSEPLLAAVIGWSVMATAMMVPSTLPVTRYLAATGLWARRQRTITLFLASYLAVWLAFGVVALAAMALLDVGTELVPGFLLVAAAWELTRWKWRWVRSCRLVSPLPPSGAEADAACCATGLRNGYRCVAACWPVMLAMAAAGHQNVGLMVELTAVVTAEKLVARPSRLATPVAAILAMSAAIAIATATAT
jgi:predicted metal-binding membrane protein